MGTQPSRKGAKRNTKIQVRKIQPDLDNCINKGDYKQAAAIISKAAQSKDSNYLVGILSAGIAAYKTKAQSEEIIKKASGDAVTKIPKNIKQNLTLPKKDSIRQAIYDTLIERSEN